MECGLDRQEQLEWFSSPFYFKAVYTKCNVSHRLDPRNKRRDRSGLVQTEYVFHQLMVVEPGLCFLLLTDVP